MAVKPQLLDRWGNPVDRATLSTEVAAPTLGGVRSPLSGYPGDGLNPARLATILRAADAGDAVQYLELAETIEERDPHYLGVVSTRKRSVAQLDITVEPASDAAQDQADADMVRDWLKRDELSQELFHILDCVSKGISFTEIIWDASAGQFEPMRLEYRDPRHFRFARRDMRTPLMLDEAGREIPLPGFRFIVGDIQAKSGLPMRSGLARVATWGWMFKAFTMRDWAIFTQTYGQPLRLGKWAPGATEKDKATLFNAVANIAGDCAGIIPKSMSIDFIETGNLGAGADLYLKRANFLDQQISKAVLGQTATTDAISGGHAVGQEHREVQEDIETSDAMALAAIINRDLIRPWIQLERGPQRRYPRVKISRPKSEDLTALAGAVEKFVNLGMEIEEAEIRARAGFSQPKPGARLLSPKTTPAPPQNPSGQPADTLPGGDPGTDVKIKGQRGEIKGYPGSPGTKVALQADGASAALPEPPTPWAVQVDRMARDGEPEIVSMLATARQVMEAASSFAEAREMLLAAWPDFDATKLAGLLAQAMLASDAMGRVEVAEDDG